MGSLWVHLNSLGEPNRLWHKCSNLPVESIMHRYSLSGLHSVFHTLSLLLRRMDREETWGHRTGGTTHIASSSSLQLGQEAKFGFPRLSPVEMQCSESMLAFTEEVYLCFRRKHTEFSYYV